MNLAEIIKQWKEIQDKRRMKNGFLAAQGDSIIDTTNPRIDLVVGDSGKEFFGLISGSSSTAAQIFSFTQNKWQPLQNFHNNWVEGAYEDDECPDGGYEEHHQVYILAKAAGFKIDPLDITIETIVSDIRDEINE